MADLKPKVSTVVKSQLPDYMKGNFEGFEQFVTLYYQWLEQSGKPNAFLHYATEEKDIDTASSVFADLHAKEFVKNYKNIKIDRKLLVKHIKEFFRAKGSLPTFDMMFEVFYNEPVEIEWGRDKIMKASDIEPSKKVIIYLDDVVGDVFQLQGSFLYQPATGVRGFVDMVALVTIAGNSLYQVQIDDTKISGIFEDRLPVWAYYRSDLLKSVNERRKVTGTVHPIIGGINIRNPGQYYSIGDPVHFIGGSGVGAMAHVSDVSTGPITGVQISRSGTGYAVGDKIYNIETGANSGSFIGEVTDIDGVGAELQPILSLNEVRIVDPGYGYHIGDRIFFKPNATQSAELEVTEVKDSDLLYDATVVNAGVGYKYVVLGVKDVFGNLMRRIWCNIRTASNGALQDIIFDYKNPLNNPVAWASNHIYSVNDEFMYNKVWYRVLFTYTSGATWNASGIDLANVEKIGPRTDGYDLYGYASSVQVNGTGAKVIPVTSGGVITSWVIKDGGFNYVRPVVKVNGTVISNSVTKNSSGVVNSVSGTYGSGYTTDTVTLLNVSGTNTVEVSIADAAKIHEGWTIYSANLPGPSNVARIESISYDTVLNKYTVILSAAVSGTGSVSATVHKVTAEIVEQYGYGAQVNTKYKTGAVKSLQIINQGKFTSTASKPTIVNGYNENSKSGTYVISSNVVTMDLGSGHKLYPGAKIKIDFTSGAATDIAIAEVYEVASTTVKVKSTQANTSGSVTVYPLTTGSGLTLRGYYFISDCKLVNPGRGYSFGFEESSRRNGSYALVDNVVTVTTLTEHKYEAGDIIVATFSTGTAVLNDVVPIATIISPTQFTFSLKGGNTSGLISVIEYYGPEVDMIDAYGKDAEVKPVIANDVITSISLSSGGTGYLNPVISVKSQYGHGFGFNARCDTDADGTITDIVILDGGQDYEAITVDDLEITGICTTPAVISSVVTKNTTIRKFEIYNGGVNYYHDMVLKQISGPGTGSTFDIEVTKEGVIHNIIPTAFGTGYTDASTFELVASDKFIYNDLATDLWVPFIDMYWPVLERVGTVDLIPRFDIAGIAGTCLTDIKVENSGTGYWNPTEISPLKIVAIDPNKTGTGAQLIPMIDDLGDTPTRSISGVLIVRAGQNYSDNTFITVSGGRGSGAILQPIIENGQIVDIEITNGGGSYYYGTKVHIIGDGEGATAVPIIDTDVNVRLENGGSSYSRVNPPTILIKDADGKGFGASFRCLVNAAGVVYDIEQTTKGSRYVAPYAVISHNGGSGLDVTVFVSRGIEEIQITSPGKNYTSAGVYIQGDGFGANAKAFVANSGLNKVNVRYGGTRITSYPTLVVKDPSNFGKISNVKIVTSSNDFKDLPVLYIESEFGKNAEVVASSSSIGKIKVITVDLPGYGYSTSPFVSTPIIVRTNESMIFKRGELVYDPLYTYPIVNGRPDYKAGPYGYIIDFEPEKNIVKITPETENITFFTENNVQIITEGTSINIAAENSFAWEGAVMTEVTNQKLLLPFNNKARGYGTVELTGQFVQREYDLKSILNNDNFMLHNNQNIQEYAYTILTGIDIREYTSMVKEYLHPAGYDLSGKIKIVARFDNAMNYDPDSVSGVAFNSPIPYKDTAAGVYEISINVDLTGPLDRGNASNSGENDFQLNLRVEDGNVYVNDTPYYKTNQFMFDNKFDFKPSFISGNGSTSTTYVQNSEFTQYYPTVANSQALIDSLIVEIMAMGRTYAEASTQALQCVGANLPAATPISMFEDLTIAQMDDSTYEFWNQKRNWARDSLVLINYPS